MDLDVPDVPFQKWFFVTILFVFLQVWLTPGYVQEIRYYKDFNGEGNGLIIVEKLEQISCILPQTFSRCVRGMWQYLDSTSGFYNIALHHPNDNEASGCSNMSTLYQHVAAVRHVGASDTSVPRLTLYEKSIGGNDGDWGKEFVFSSTWTGEPLPVKWAGFTGWSNWTLYEHQNFQGKTWCLRATHELDWMIFSGSPSLPTQVGSIVPGCLADG